MKLVFGEQAWEDYLYWQEHDLRLLARINELIRECTRTPFKGIGKPEPLRGSLSGWWSRRSIASTGWSTRSSMKACGSRSVVIITERAAVPRLVHPN